MEQVFSFISILGFFVAYLFTKDFMIATMVILILMGAHVLFATIKGQLTSTLKITFLMAFVLGGLTLLLDDPLFFKWKPTIVNIIFSIGLLATVFYRYDTQEANVLKKLLEPNLKLPVNIWRNIAFFWSGAFLLSALINWYVLAYFTESFWVSFKVFGGILLTFIYLIIMFAYLGAKGYLSISDKEDDC